MPTVTRSRDITRLLEIMAKLRDPDTGCPWDVAQTFATIAPYTVEEAYEVADAIARGDVEDLKDELGDLLLQVVFHARIAEEDGRFDFGDVVDAITAKLVRRHPHVFGPHVSGPDGCGAAGRRDTATVNAQWDAIKAQERAERARRRAAAPGGASDRPAGALSGVALALPALTRARKLQDKAGQVGFDWNDAGAVLAKIREETEEIAAEVAAGRTAAARAEVGDLLFAAVNLARHLDGDPEALLGAASAKFERRFGHIEDRLAASGRTPAQSTLAEMDALWNEAKDLEADAPEAKDPEAKDPEAKGPEARDPEAKDRQA